MYFWGEQAIWGLRLRRGARRDQYWEQLLRGGSARNRICSNNFSPQNRSCSEVILLFSILVVTNEERRSRMLWWCQMVARNISPLNACGNNYVKAWLLHFKYDSVYVYATSPPPINISTLKLTIPPRTRLCNQTNQNKSSQHYHPIVKAANPI